jgi:hypothetical protein
MSSSVIGLSVGRGPEELPSDEVQWLLATCWNKSALPAKLQKHAEAEKWMRLAFELLKLARDFPSIETLKPQMIQSYHEVEKMLKNVDNRNGCKQAEEGGQTVVQDIEVG